MKTIFSSIWSWLTNKGANLLKQIAKSILAKAKTIAEDQNLISLALSAIQAAAHQGLTGDKAWTAARNTFTAALANAGKQLGNCAIDTILQSTYAAFKDTTEK